MNLDIFMRWWWYAGSGSDLTIIKTQHTSDHQGGLRKWKEMFLNKLSFLGKFGSSMFLWRCKCYIWIKPIHYIYVHCTTCILEKVTFRPKEDKRGLTLLCYIMWQKCKVTLSYTIHCWTGSADSQPDPLPINNQTRILNSVLFLSNNFDFIGLTLSLV